MKYMSVFSSRTGSRSFSRTEEAKGFCRFYQKWDRHSGRYRVYISLRDSRSLWHILWENTDTYTTSESTTYSRCEYSMREFTILSSFRRRAKT